VFISKRVRQPYSRNTLVYFSAPSSSESETKSNTKQYFKEVETKPIFYIDEDLIEYAFSMTDISDPIPELDESMNICLVGSALSQFDMELLSEFISVAKEFSTVHTDVRFTVADLLRNSLSETLADKFQIIDQPSLIFHVNGEYKARFSLQKSDLNLIGEYCTEAITAFHQKEKTLYNPIENRESTE